MVPVLSLAEACNRYSQCLFQGYGLLKYIVFCQVAVEPRRVNALDTTHFLFFIDIAWSITSKAFNKSVKAPTAFNDLFQMIDQYSSTIACSVERAVSNKEVSQWSDTCKDGYT